MPRTLARALRWWRRFWSVAPETRYVRAGDVHIAYQVVGDGPIDLVYVPP